jgi:hypothetical protein
MKKNKKSIDVDSFQDPFTVFASGFAIILPAEMGDADNEKPLEIKHRRLFRKKKK